MHPVFLEKSPAATPISLVRADRFEDWLKTQDSRAGKMAEGTGFKAEAGKLMLVSNAEGGVGQVVLGIGEGAGGGGDSFILAPLPSLLPAGDYVLADIPDGLNAETLALGWADGAYRFTRYKKSDDKPRRLVLPAKNSGEPVDADEVSRQAEAIDLVRDLVNTPASDMGPQEITGMAQALAAEFGADIQVTTGKMLETGYPMVHAVGKGASQPPRFIEIGWRKDGGKPHPKKLVIVGKGVAFDTGGLDLKGGANMLLMKKDMGGAAHALGLARLVMSAGLDVQLIVAIPAVENSIGPDAFRPSDVLKSRKGLTVEIENTDAEGRLILGDALARACEHKPDLIIDFATLTGAARVALGPDLAPLYTDDDQLAADIEAGGRATGDAVWRMPLWAPYEAGLKSSIADLKNLGDGPMAGSITAALFLKKFVSGTSWVHFDIWAWRPARYGRPAGAAACGLRAVWSMLKTRYGEAG